VGGALLLPRARAPPPPRPVVTLALARRRRRRPADWLAKGLLQKLVLVISSAITKEVLERWTFEIDTSKEVLAKG
jgi:hypothetical protein